MRNIHILPTKEPSRLYLDSQNNICITDIEMKIGIKLNIYITSDEEIKEGDWCYDKILNIIFQTDNHTDFTYVNLTNNVSKIILTTDPKLIADGVQSIDEEFLQWFVKNPICEEVEVEKYCSTGRKCNDKGLNCHNAKLKIILPK